MKEEERKKKDLDMSLARVCRRRVPTVRTLGIIRLLLLRHSSSSRSSRNRDIGEVAVFWDFENCPVPSALDPFLLRRNLECTLRGSGFHGPISLRGYGNIQLISRAHVLEALSETGIDLHHVPNGGKNSSDRALLIDMLLWTFKHSPPAHVLLISGDSDFSVLLHKMRMLSYNVLLAAPNKTGMSPALVHAADRVWVWPDIVMTEKPSQEDTEDVPNDDSRNKSSKQPPDLMETDRRSSKEDNNKYELYKATEAQWLPPNVMKKIVDIVEERPGISMGHISKELRSFDINPRSFGFTNFYQLLISVRQLQVCYVDGLNMKDRVKFYLANEEGHKASGTLMKRRVVSGEKSQSQIIKDLPDAETADQSSATSKKAIGDKQMPVFKKKTTWYSWFTNLFKGS